MKQNDVGKIKVVEAYSDYAICKAESHASGIHKGDVVKRG